jgi:SSS family solute:Na+ symporter
VDHYGLAGRMSEGKKVFIARTFVVTLLAIVFVAAQYADQRTIFGTGIWCFTAFSSLFPILLAALFWKRSTKVGIAASALTVAILVPLFYCLADYGQQEKYTITSVAQVWQDIQALLSGRNIKPHTEGVLPVAIILPAAATILIVFSLVSRPPTSLARARFFPQRSVTVEAAVEADGQPTMRGTPVRT